MYAIAAFYKFAPLTESRLEALRTCLLAAAESAGVVGLVLLSGEGCNGTVAAEPAGLTLFKDTLRAEPEFADIEFKDSRSERRPFRRFTVDRRRELITLKQEVEAPGADTYLSPEAWHARLSGDDSVIVLDVRNTYETELGIFKGAVTLPIDKFSDLPKVVAESGLSKDRPVLMYCTGGIRCEKALPALKQQGFGEVYQLHGGILRYLEAFPEGHFQGECFVFDHRVAVDARLEPSQRWSLCPLCGNPAEHHLACAECSAATVLCRRCAGEPLKQACSKNCAYHLRRKASNGLKAPCRGGQVAGK